MKTRTALSWLLLAGMLAGGAAQATLPDRDAGTIYGNALHLTWRQGEAPAKASLRSMNSQLTRDQSKDHGDIPAHYASMRATARTNGQPMLNIYALGCVIYLAFIFLLGLFVGFNELDRDK